MLGPSITIGAATFNSLDGNGGKYVWTGATRQAPNGLEVSHQMTKQNVQRSKVERYITIPATATEPAMLARVYLIVEAPRHSGATAAVLQPIAQEIATFFTLARAEAIVNRMES